MVKLAVINDLDVLENLARYCSGMVMQACAMKYCYTYEEQWQPKDFPVFCRMYQLNFDSNDDFAYKKYCALYENHFIDDV